MATETVNKLLPWKSGVPAWIMAVEGAIIAGIGLFVINRGDTASRAVLLALGALMLFNGAPRLMRYYGQREDTSMSVETLHGWFGVIAGVIAILFTLIAGPENLSTIAILFGIALIISGGLELYERFTSGEDNRLMRFALPAVLIVAGLMLIIISLSATITPMVFGQLLALLGFVLLALGLIRMYSNHQREQALKEADAKHAQLAQEIVAAEQRTDEPAAPPPVVSPAAAAPSGDEPEDPAVKAALEP